MQRFKRILCYVGTESNETALSRAIALAAANDAKLTVMDVIKPIPRTIGLITDTAKPEELQDLVVKDHKHRLLNRMAEYSDTSVTIDVKVTAGDPATEIVRQVLSDETDLVIKTADGFSPAGRLFGSIARTLLRMCPCPVWVLKPEIHGEFDRIVAAVDLDANDTAHRQLNREILELSFSIAKIDQAQLHVVSAWNLWMEGPLRKRAGDEAVNQMLKTQEVRMHQALDELLQAPMSQDKNIHLHLKQGEAAQVIHSVVDEVEADLVVMGTVCRTGAAGFLIGNTAETIIPELTCSMLALKPQGFVSPVQTADDDEDSLEGRHLPTF
ncbi:MAG: universal stress protein [Pirellulales bacterium]|nr:universal stress protein [Pirellulales bacterium]